jgi:hypothetical protein
MQILSVLTIILGLGSAWAAEVASELPKPALEVLAKMDRKMDDARSEAVAALERLLKTYASKGDLDSANAIKAKIDNLKAPQPDLLGGATPALPPGKYTLTAKCDDSFIIYLNGKLVLEGNGARGGKGVIEWVPNSLLVVRAQDDGGNWGFSMTLTAADGAVALTTEVGNAWKSFVPPSDSGWWKAERIKNLKPAIAGNASGSFTIDGATPLWGDGAEGVCYLVYTP